MKLNQIMRLAVIGLTLSGCASPTWVKPGANEQALLTDQYYCDRDVRQSNFGETGENQAAQMAGGWAAAGNSIGSGMSSLGAAIEKKNFANRCMIAHGWREQADTTVHTSSAALATVPVVTEKPSNNLTTTSYNIPIQNTACTKQEIDLAAWSKQNGYQYNSACQ